MLLPMAQRIAVVLALLALASLAIGRRFEPKGASITLHAKWLGTPLVHEAAEFLVSSQVVLGLAATSIMRLPCRASSRGWHLKGGPAHPDTGTRQARQQ